jgi:3'-5' exonuclease
MQQIQLENLLLMDIETVSSVEEFGGLTEEWKELWAEKIIKSLPPETTPEEYYPMKAAILAEFGKVICISSGYFKKEGTQWKLRIKSFYSVEEKDVLENFMKALEQLHSRQAIWTFTGHNIKEFDIPYICRRMLANQMQLPAFMDFQNMKPWETPILDTLHLWRFGDYKHYTSLKLLAATLGVPSPKDDIDGSKVGEVFWQEKDLERIVTYCQKDVVTVANVILRFKNLPLLGENQIILVP